MFGPRGCSCLAVSTLGTLHVGQGTTLEAGSLPSLTPGGKYVYLRSSPTFKISHSILVSSILLRPKGHSCLSSRLLFSSTICKQEREQVRKESQFVEYIKNVGSTIKRNRSTPDHQTRALGGRTKLYFKYILCKRTENSHVFQIS